MRNLLLLFSLAAVACFAQSVTIVSPGSGAIISGYSSPVTCTLGSITNAYWIQLLVNGESQGYWPTSSPDSCPGNILWNTYNFGNGENHTLQVKALGADGVTVLATSAAQVNPIENWLPQQTCAFNATPSSACTDIAVVPGYAASVQFPQGSGFNWVASTISIKPAASTPPAPTGANTVVSTSGQTSITTPGRAVASTSNWILIGILGQNNSPTVNDTLTNVVDSDGNDPFTTPTTTQGCTTASTTGGYDQHTRWCWIKATSTHGSGYTVTATWSVAQNEAQVIRVYELTNVASASAIDVQLGDGSAIGSGSANAEPVTSGVTPAVANESIFSFFSHRPVSGGYPTTTAAPLYTAVQDANNYTTAEYSTTTVGWYGQMALAVTVNGANAGVVKTWTQYIGGRGAGVNQQNASTVAYSATGGYNSPVNTATSLTLYYDTINPQNAWYNGNHQVVLMATNTNSTNCPGGSSAGCPDGAWNALGQWEQTENFVNPVLPVELTLTYRDQKAVCAGSIPSSCGSITALSGTLHFTDGSTSAATIGSSGCGASSNTAAATVAYSAGTCAWNPVAYGSASSTVTESTYGMTRASWLHVVAANNYPNIGIDGSTQTAYVPGNSSFIRSSFHSGSAIVSISSGGDGTTQYSAAQAGTDYASAGFNGIESGEFGPVGIIDPPGSGGTSTVEATWDTAQGAAITAVCSILTANHLSGNWQGNAWVQDNGNYIGLYSALHNYAAAFATPPLQYVFAQWLSSCPGAFPRITEMQDEIYPDNWFGGASPNACGAGNCTLGSTGGPIQVACTISPSLCTVSWTGYLLGVHLIITGSGVTALDYSTSATNPTPSVYNPTAVDANSFTFPNPGVGVKTYTASSNNCGAGGASTCTTMQFQPLAIDTVDSTSIICAGRTGAGLPCVGWNAYNDFQTLHTQARAGSSKANLSYAPAGIGNSTFWETQWCGNAAVADWCDFYNYGQESLSYTPTNSQIYGLLNINGNSFRASYGGLFATKPSSILSGVNPNGYALNGYPVAVTSCSGSTITFAAPHNLPNVFNGISRLWVTSATGTCNGRYYILSTPTSTTATVGGFETLSPTLMNITFTGGGTFNGVTMGVNGGGGYLSDPNCATDNIKNHRGQTFTTSTDSNTYYYAIENPDSCTVPYGEYTLLVPSLSATGGTAYIIADNNVIPGRNWSWEPQDARATFAGSMYPLILGAMATRSYNIVPATQAYDRLSTNAYDGFTGNSLNYRGVWEDSGTTLNLLDVQPGIHALYPITPSSPASWTCQGYGNLVTGPILPYHFQPSLSYPDLGQFYEAAVHQDGSGNTVLTIQQFYNEPSTLTVNLAPYLISGKAIIKYLVSCDGGIQVSTISAGTMSDTITAGAAWFAAYVFLNTPAGFLNQPVISPRFADWPTASQVRIDWAYGCSSATSCYPFSQGAGAQNVLPQSYICSSAPCTLPADRNIGPITYRLVPLTSGNKVAATGTPAQF